MATVTPTSFRTAVKTRMVVTGIEFTDTQLDEAGRAAFNAAFPALYKTQVDFALPVITNPTTGFGSLTVADSSRVFEIDDSNTEQELVGWSSKTGTTIRRIASGVTKVDVYSFGPISYPTSDGNPVVVPDEWLDALYTFAEVNLIEGILGDKAQFRGYQANSREGMPNETELTQMVGLLYQKWQRERDEHAAALPARRL